MRFRKSIKVGGVRINLSKSGIGGSVGIKGFRIGVNSKNRTYISSGIPGTGFYKTMYFKEGKKQISPVLDSKNTRNDPVFPQELRCRLFFFWSYISIFLIIIYFQIGFVSIIVQMIWYNKYYKKTDKYKAFSLYNAAVQAINDENYDLSAENLNQILLLFPNIKSVKELLTQCYIRLEDYQSALKNLQSYCGDEEEKIHLMSIAYKANEFQTVIDNAQNLTEETKKDVFIITLMGKSYYKLGQYDLALNILSKGPIKKRSMNDAIAEYRYALGKTYEALGKNKNALKQYIKVNSYNENYKDIKKKIESLQ